MPSTEQPTPVAHERWVVGIKMRGKWDIEIAGPGWDQAVAAAKRIAARHMDEGQKVLDPEFPGSDSAVDDVFGQVPYGFYQDSICESCKDFSSQPVTA